MMSYDKYMERIEKEWKDIFSTDREYYLYGAALNARRMLLMAKKTGVISKIKGCLVTNKDKNPEYCEDLKVMPISQLSNKDAVILVSHMGRQRKEIMQLLEKYNFKNIVPINKFYTLVDWKIKGEICDTCMEHALRLEREIYENKTQEDLESDLSIYQEIVEIMQNQAVGFGGQVTYQSFEKLAIPGVRPSLYRIIKYGLKDVLSASHQVLDIGCNVGFLDMSVAEMVNSITGVEYDESLVKVANVVKNYLRMDNCFFEHKDFDSWYIENTKTYDVIFSFAIHHWLNLVPTEYADRIDKILNNKGYICIESHVGDDVEYKGCLDSLLQKEYCICGQGTIRDDGMREREWCLLQKS